MAGDAVSGYEIVEADGVLIDQPQRLYSTRERAAKVTKRFRAKLDPCARPDVEEMMLRGSCPSIFRQLVGLLY
jgi:hypothetical protein